MRLIAVMLLVFICFHIHAQQLFGVKGMVHDSSGKKIEDGLASLFLQEDSTLIGHTLITDGVFEFSALHPQPYLLKTSCVGFEETSRIISVTDHQSLKIELKRNRVALKEVQITGYKNAFSYKNGNVKATVENTILSTIPDVVEVLSKLPAVQVSSDRESISIIGRGNPVIYLENQRITLNELNALSVNDIKTIEIINNPSSKYEAEGRSVILITRKKNTKAGTRAEVNETASLKRYLENRSGVNLYFRKNKTEWRSNLQYNHINRFEGIQGVLIDNANFFTSGYGGTSVGPRRQLLYGMGVHRQLNETDYFSINVRGRFQDEHDTVAMTSHAKQGFMETVTTNTSKTTNNRPFINFSFNYQKKFEANNSQLFAGGQVARYTTDVNSKIYYNDTLNQQQLQEERRQYFVIDAGTVRVDYEKNFPNEIKWESGGLINLSGSTTTFDIRYVPDNTSKHTQYRYTENNQAIYSQVTGSFRRVNGSVGLRAEHSILEGGYPDSNTMVLDKQFLYFFPKLSISVAADSNHHFLLSYARSIRRPNYANANQVSIYLTPFLERTNNINISPSLMDEISFNYQYKTYSVTTSLYTLRHTGSYIMEYDAELKKYRMINRNIGKFEGVNVSLNIPFSYESFSSNNQVMATLNRVSDSRANSGKTAPYYYFYSNNQLKLPRQYTFVLSGWFLTTQNEGIFETNSKYAVDISVSKVFFKRLTCTLNAFDIFRSLNNTESFKLNGIYAATTYIENVKEFSIALKYSFGKMKEHAFRNKEVNENGNRLN
ncbi:MAG: outer membrane beta-barrel family protein [Bacteroidota bacterium]